MRVTSSAAALPFLSIKSTLIQEPFHFFKKQERVFSLLRWRGAQQEEHFKGHPAGKVSD